MATFAGFAAVFGGTERLVRVMASQAANAWLSETVLEFEGAAAQVDAVAIAPYLGGYLGGPDQRPRVASMSGDAFFSELNDIALPRVVTWLAAHAAVTESLGLELIAYEGGQHLVGHSGVHDDDEVNAQFDAANRDPRMGALYSRYLQAWRGGGVHLFVHFTSCGRYGRFGRWGSLEWLTQPASEAPKFQALQTFITDNPRWW